MELFDRQGYSATTVDAIAEGAGVSRRTFFHHFASKDAVVFPDHEALIERVRTYLVDQGDTDPMNALGGALRLILSSFLADRDLALRRYQLIRRTPELREREVAWVQRYQLLFSRYLAQPYAHDSRGSLLAELVAACVVSLHNHVLREWLKRDGEGNALGDLDDALNWFEHSLALAQRGDGPRRLVVAIFDDDIDPQELTARVREVRNSAPTSSAPTS